MSLFKKSSNGAGSAGVKNFINKAATAATGIGNTVIKLGAPAVATAIGGPAAGQTAASITSRMGDGSKAKGAVSSFFSNLFGGGASVSTDGAGGVTVETGGGATEPNMFTKAWEWIKAKPLETVGILTGTVVGIWALCKYVFKIGKNKWRR